MDSFIQSSKGRSALRGSVERINFFNAETGQCILDIKPENSNLHVLVSAQVPFVHPGFRISAEVVADDRSTLLRSDKLELQYPESEKEIKKFLRSGAVPHIGPKLITLLVRSFSTSLLEILDRSPERLLEIAGIGNKRQATILRAWNEYRNKKTLERFLFDKHLPLNWASDLWGHYGENSIHAILEEPYKTAEKCNFAFEAIDKFALANGFSLDSLSRVRAGLIAFLQNYYRQGHCAYPESKIVEEMLQKLEVSRDLIEEAIESEFLDEKIVTDTISGVDCLYLKEIWLLEREVAGKLLLFENKSPPWGYFNSAKVLSWAQNILDIKLAPMQKEAIEAVLSSSLTVITGGPGTGKTTLIRSLVTILQTQFLKFALCSPTGRAAQRLSQATGMPASTVHRLLKSDPLGNFQYNKNNPLDLDLVLVDEGSMVDLTLISKLLDALPEHCALVFVGDVDQIPSVGAGSILRSLINSGRFQVVKLTDVFRQKEKSAIKINAQRINLGEMPIDIQDGQKDFHYFPIHDSFEAKKILLELVTEIIPGPYGIPNLDQLQILVPLNRGVLGTQRLNEEIQDYMIRSTNYKGPYLRGVTEANQKFKLGDKVIVVKNNYAKEVFNGDIGFVMSINDHEQFIDVDVEGRRVQFGFDELDHLNLAYVISVHKAQGSEYRAVVILLTEDHLPMAQKHLIYTAVTRGKEHVFLIAQPKSLQEAIRNEEFRWEKLTELLAV